MIFGDYLKWIDYLDDLKYLKINRTDDLKWIGANDAVTGDEHELSSSVSHDQIADPLVNCRLTRHGLCQLGRWIAGCIQQSSSTWLPRPEIILKPEL